MIHRLIKKIEKKDWYAVSAILLFYFMVILFFRQHMFYYDPDTYYRLHYSEYGVDNVDLVGINRPDFIFNGVWLPLFHIIERTIILYFDAPVSRIYDLILAMSFATTIVFYFFVKRCFNRGIAFLSSLIAASLPVFLGTSLQAMSEIPFLLFIILSFYYFFEIDNKQNFLGFSIFFLLASMTRQEAWALIPFFIFFLPRDMKKAKKYFSILMLIIFPLLCVGVNYAYNHSLIQVPKAIQSNMITVNSCSLGIHNAITMISLFYMSLPLVLIILGIVGIIDYIKNKLKSLNRKEIFYLSLFFYFSGIMISASTICLVKSQRVVSERHLLLIMLLFVPFISHTLIKISDFLKKRALRILSIMIFILLLSGIIISSLNKAIDLFNGDKDAKLAAEFVKGNVAENEKIIVDAPWQERFLIAGETRLLASQILTNDLDPAGTKYYDSNFSSVKYIIYNESELDERRFIMNNFSFSNIKRFGDYHIFQKTNETKRQIE